MLTVTDQAIAAIRTMTNIEVYPKAGLRITSEPEADLFAIAIVPDAVEDDIAIPAAEANVYLDQDAALALDSATLVAGGDGVGTQKFALVK